MTLLPKQSEFQFSCRGFRHARMMPDLYTPKQIARAIQVSESSIKRWCDQGLIATSYTAGGHRRVDLSSFMEFVKTHGYPIVKPEVLGLPAAIGQSRHPISRMVEPFLEALLRGDEQVARQIVIDLFLAENSLARICDELIAKAFEAIGNLWECGSAQVYQERRSCEICQRIFYELRALVPAAPETSSLALGGAPEGDRYSLSSLAVEIVLRDLRWNASHLGSHLPLSTLRAAILEKRPRLFWLSVSHLEEPAQFVDGFRSLYDEFQNNTLFVLGGRALTEELRRQLKYAVYCDTLQHLEAFVESLAGQTRLNS